MLRVKECRVIALELTIQRVIVHPHTPWLMHEELCNLINCRIIPYVINIIICFTKISGLFNHLFIKREKKVGKLLIPLIRNLNRRNNQYSMCILWRSLYGYFNWGQPMQVRGVRALIEALVPIYHELLINKQSRLKIQGKYQ